MSNINVTSEAVKMIKLLNQDKLDVYLPRGVNGLRFFRHMPITLTRIFTRREGAMAFGFQEFLLALLSILSGRDKRISGKTLQENLTIYAVPEGTRVNRHETMITIAGPATWTMLNETILKLISHGMCYRTRVEEYKDKPWTFFGARYLDEMDCALYHRALQEVGSSGTISAYLQDPRSAVGTMSHSQITAWGYTPFTPQDNIKFKKNFACSLDLEECIEKSIFLTLGDWMYDIPHTVEGLRATIRATVAFAAANPDVPAVVLADYVCRTIGVAKTVIATAKVFDVLESETGGRIKLAGYRGDISKADLLDVPIRNASLLDNPLGDKILQGMSLEATRSISAEVAQAGYGHLKFVVSSGIPFEKIDDYIAAGADLIGIGEKAASYDHAFDVTSDCSAVDMSMLDYFEPMAKEGRDLRIILDEEMMDSFREAGHDININPGRMKKVDLEPYVKLLDI